MFGSLFRFLFGPSKRQQLHTDVRWAAREVADRKVDWNKEFYHGGLSSVRPEDYRSASQEVGGRKLTPSKEQDVPGVSIRQISEINYGDAQRVLGQSQDGYHYAVRDARLSEQKVADHLWNGPFGSKAEAISNSFHTLEEWRKVDRYLHAGLNRESVVNDNTRAVNDNKDRGRDR